MSMFLDDPDYTMDEEAEHNVYDSMPASPDNGGNNNGLGSLADELAAAEDDDDEDEEEEEEAFDGATEPVTADKTWTSALKVKTNGTSTPKTNGTATPVDGVSAGIPASLEEKLNQVEAEALKGLSMVKTWRRAAVETTNGYKMMNGSKEQKEEEDDVKRLMKGLQDLKSQSSIETGSQRLITAHSSLSSHVANQTRNLRDLSQFLITPLQMLFPFDEQDATQASELLTSLLELVPQPTPLPLHELSQLHAMTLSLITQLSYVSDSLHMARQQSNAAGRKLRGVKEACREWRNEIDEVERARAFIEDGNWDARLKRREAEGVCRDVLGGFEDVCKGMERRIEGFC